MSAIGDFIARMKEQYTATTMSETEFLETAIAEWETSDTFRMMIEGQRYYAGDNDINKRAIMMYDETGRHIVDPTATNIKLSHAFMTTIVDEKVGYLFGNAPTYSIDKGNEDFEQIVTDTLDKDFDSTLNDIATDASNCGVSWVHLYGKVDSGVDGSESLELGIINVPPEQCIPLWLDDAHTQLGAMIRYYYAEEYVSFEKKYVRKVEFWTDETVAYYRAVDGGALVFDIEKEPMGEPVPHHIWENVDGEGQRIITRAEGWGKVPFIAFKNNSQELSDLKRVKSLIDAYDLSTSDMAILLADVKELIYVLTNYDGTSLREFKENLKWMGVVKIDQSGGVETLESNINEAASEAHLNRIKNDFYEFAQAVNNRDEVGNNPSGVALEFLYAALKLKANKMERKFVSAFESLFWFVARFQYLIHSKTFDPKTANVTFTRSSITNVKEAVETANTSTMLISTETALGHHPWVDDVEEELARLDEQNAMPAQTFGEGNAVGSVADDLAAAPDETPQGKPLTAAMATALVNFAARFNAGELTETQAIALIARSLSISKDEARELLLETV